MSVVLLAVLTCVESVRECLKFDRSDGPPIRFPSASRLCLVQGDPDAVLRAADADLYREKGSTSGRLRSG